MHIQLGSTTDNQELIVKLIKEELRSNKLTWGLYELGVLSELYYSDLSMVILDLMGFEDRDDNLYKFYDEQMEIMITIETSQFHEQLDSLAQGLYEQLMRRKG